MISDEERILKVIWHALTAGVGIYEFRTQKSKLSKILSVGLIAFHIDATICDWQDRPTTLQRLIRRLRK